VNWRGFVRKRSWANRVAAQAFVWRKATETSFGIARVQAEIGTEHLPNTRL
jgi:hypothetical protein